MKLRKITRKLALATALATVSFTSVGVLGTSVYAQDGENEVKEVKEETGIIADSEEIESIDAAVDSDAKKQNTKETDEDFLTEEIGNEKPENLDKRDFEEKSPDKSESETLKTTESTEKMQMTDTMKAKDTTEKTPEKVPETTKEENLNGWQTISGKKYYYKDGVKQTGWLRIENIWYYLGSDGIMKTGWQEIGQGTVNPDGKNKKHWSYFGDDGKLREGWQQLGQGTNNPDGKNPKHWSYFGPNGWLREGWQQLGQGTNNPDGKNQKHWSYFGPNGWLREGWQEMGQGTSNPDGKNQKHWSYFGPNGWLRTGMQNMGTASNPDGKNKQHLSYFGENGWLVVSKEFYHNNIHYIADAKGWLTQIKTEHEKALGKAMQLVGQLTNDSMSKREKLLKCYSYIQSTEFKRPWLPHYYGNDWPQKYANNWFDKRSGNCFSYASALGYVAKVIGYENVYCCNGKIHGWAEIDGLIYDTSKGYRGISYDQKAAYDYKKLISSGESYVRVKI